MSNIHKKNKHESGDANSKFLQKNIGKRLTCGNLGFGGIILIAALLLWLSPAYSGGTIIENFDNNQYNKKLWNEWTSGEGTTAQVANNRLEVNVAGPGYAGLNASGFSLIGDFEMKVDFTLLNWPPHNGTQLTIGEQTVSTNLLQLGRANTTDQEQYFTVILNQYTASAEIPGPPPLSGTLRIVRTGNTMEGSFWNGTGWQVVGSKTDLSLGAKVAVNLNVGPYGNQYSEVPAKVAFDNIQITYTRLGPSLWQRNPGPAIMLLLLDQK